MVKEYNDSWRPDSWRSKNIEQNIVYEDPDALNLATDYLKNQPSLLSFEQIKSFRDRLADFRGFIIQAGDCAETIKNSDEAAIYANKLGNLLHMMAVEFKNYCGKDVLLIGRMAGQFAKPRTAQKQGDILSYRGDLINNIEPDAVWRRPDPNRLISGYNYAKEVIQHSPKNIYFSHEALFLPYEESLTRKKDERYYASSAHMLWIGERTRQLANAHIEYCSGVYNPIGVKISHKITSDEILRLCDILNPDNEVGKLIFITRMGCDKIEDVLPSLIKAIRRGQRNVIWLCDPMHGNSYHYNNIKMRNIIDIKKETKSFFDIHKRFETIGAGVHLELTYDDVYECFENKFDKKQIISKSYCDPRLNLGQAQEYIKFLGHILQEENKC